MNNYIYFLGSIFIMIFLFFIYPRLRGGLFLVGIVTGLIYITWRFTTVPSGKINFVIGVILLGAEICSLIQFLVFTYITSREKIYRNMTREADYVKTVDIFIPTYGEPIYILKKTIAACLEIEYPKDKKNIFVCDDSKRLEVKELCEEFNVNYSIRSDNTHAKSGNINNVLSNSKGEIVVVFDADMLPKNNFLTKTIGYFKDKEIGFIQIPQSFYNPDIFQKHISKNIPCEQDFFMRDVQEKRSYISADIHVGTNALFRREALEKIGGYPTFSITEDIALGVLIQAAGYKSIYLNETLATGLNPNNLKDFLSQRDRWCRGNLQLLKNKGILNSEKLSFSQRLVYKDGLFSWYSGILKIIFILAPIIFLTTGTFFIDASIKMVLIMFLPYYISQYFIFTTHSPNTRSMFWAHFYETIMAPYNTLSCLKNDKGKKGKVFKVTNKDIQKVKNKRYIKQATPHIILLSITMIAWGIGIIKYSLGNIRLDIFLINAVWTIYNAIPMIGLIYISLKKDYEFENEVILKGNEYVSFKRDKQEVKYKIHSIKDNSITLRQEGKKILLKNDVVTLTYNGGTITGKVSNATNGLAAISLMYVEKDAYIKLMGIYANEIRPFYDLEEKISK